jgi:hypothetical protein
MHDSKLPSGSTERLSYVQSSVQYIPIISTFREFQPIDTPPTLHFWKTAGRVSEVATAGTGYRYRPKLTSSVCCFLLSFHGFERGSHFMYQLLGDAHSTNVQ